jgi:hypothetical protein
MVVTSLLVGLFLVEVSLRVLYPGPQMMEFHPSLGALPRPHLNIRKTFGGHERVVNIETNSLGLRAPENLPAPGVRRVLALGDSFTFGDAVEQTEAWPYQLARRLNASGARERYETLDAGVSGYGTAQELLLFRTLKPLFTPDVVVLGFSIVNDELDNLCIEESTYRPKAHVPCFTLTDDRLIVREPTPMPARAARAGSFPPLRSVDLLVAQAKGFTVWNPGLLRFADRIGLRVELPYMPATIASWYDRALAEPGWQLTRRLLLELRDEARADDVPLVILVVPSSLQVDGARREVVRVLGRGVPSIEAFLLDPYRPQRLLQEFCSIEAILCVDPLAAILAERARGEILYYPLDQHWTPAAHAIAADLLAERLRQLRLRRSTGRGARQ